VTTDTALRLGRDFDTSAAFWINLRTRHDLARSRDGLSGKIEVNRPREVA
jgi:plasmid maintenance system antidote protein VapI